MREKQEQYNLPEGWQLVKLCDIAHINMGQSPPSNTYNYEGVGLPFFQGKSEFGELYPTINKYCSEPIKIAQKDEILISVRAPIGPTNLAPEKCCIGRGIASIKPFGGISPKYILWYLRSIENLIISLGTGSVFKAISKNVIENIKIPVSSNEVMDKIVFKLEEVFSCLDKTEEQLNNSLRELEIYQKVVLRNSLDENLYKKIISERNFNSWIELTLEEVCEKITDGSHFSPKSNFDGYPYITVKDLKNDLIDFDNSIKVSKEDYLKLKKSGCQPLENDVLFSKDGTVGKVSLINFKKEFVVLSSLAILRPNQNVINPKLLFYILKSPQLINQALDQKKGVAIRRIVLRDLKKIKLQIPVSLNEQDLIVSKLDLLISYNLELKAEVKKSINHVDILKKSLLKKAFEGSLIEEHLEIESLKSLQNQIEIDRKNFELNRNPIKKKLNKVKLAKYSLLQSLKIHFSEKIFSINEIKTKIEISDEKLKEELFKLLDNKEVISFFDSQKGSIFYKLKYENHKN